MMNATTDTELIEIYGTELRAIIYYDETPVDSYEIKYIQDEGMVG